MKPHTEIQVKRIYEAASAEDGLRVLADRVWPRGISKEEAALDAWEKDLAPTTALRKWFGHKPERFMEFRQRYRQELEAQADVLDALLARAKGKKLSLLFGAKDTEHNNAVVLREVLKERIR